MPKKLYVGNLPFSATEDAVRTLFAQYGEIISVRIITDQATGRSRGFCFVEMENADRAIAELNETEFEGRSLKVNEAHERKPRQGGGGGGGGGFRRDKRRDSRFGGGGGQRGRRY